MKTSRRGFLATLGAAVAAVGLTRLEPVKRLLQPVPEMETAAPLTKLLVKTKPPANVEAFSYRQLTHTAPMGNIYFMPGDIVKIDKDIVRYDGTGFRRLDNSRVMEVTSETMVTVIGSAAPEASIAPRGNTVEIFKTR